MAKVYNASNNELVRTNTLVKGAIIQVDATPFRLWYESHVSIFCHDEVLATCSNSSPQYAQPVTKKGAKAAAAEEKKEGEDKKLSNHAQRNLAERRKGKHRFFLLGWSPVLI
jgi:small subunit ribosomal protein S8e